MHLVIREVHISQLFGLEQNVKTFWNLYGSNRPTFKTNLVHELLINQSVQNLILNFFFYVSLNFVEGPTPETPIRGGGTGVLR